MEVINQIHTFVKQQQNGDDYGPWSSTYVQLETKQFYDYGWSEEDIKQEIYETFDRTCHCQHDCCACWNGGITDLKRIGKWTYKGIISMYMNV